MSSCCLYELSLDTKLRDEAREEIKDTIDTYGGVNYDSLFHMRFLDKCFNETLRKYPPALFLQRKCTKAYNITDSNVTIPKGQSVQIPVYAIHWDENIFPRPEKFDPERFSPDETAKRHPMTFLGFGLGQRKCIGSRMAFIMVKLVLVKILMSYEFELDRSKTSIPLRLAQNNFVLMPAEGVFMKIKKIENK